MFKHHEFHGHTPEFPPFHGHHFHDSYGHHHDPYGCMEPCVEPHRPVQADWEERNPRKLSYIQNKPAFVETINGVEPDINGNVNITAAVLKAGSLSNAEIYNIVSKVYGDKSCGCNC